MNYGVKHVLPGVRLPRVIEDIQMIIFQLQILLVIYIKP